MFIGAFELSAAWSQEGVKGCRRFLDRIWKLQDMIVDGEEYSKELETKMHQTIKKVSGDFENLKFNTAIAAMMSLVNDFYKAGKVTRGEFKTLLILMNPVASHMTEELWEMMNYGGRLYETTWPKWDEEKTVESTIEIAVQVNGKVKDTITVEKEEEQDSVKEKVFASDSVKAAVEGKNIVKEIYVKGRIYNIVVK
jgi:leucyl-tRNA synthetase